MYRITCVELNAVQSRWPDAKGPDGKVSRHTVRLATQGWTSVLEIQGPIYDMFQQKLPPIQGRGTPLRSHEAHTI